MKRIAIAFVLISIFFSNICSQGIPYGREFQVNAYIQGYQSHPSVAGLKDGGFVTCWESEEQDSGIFGQIFEASGVKRGNEFQVNTYTNNFQFSSSITRLKNDGFAVCWISNEQDGSESGIFGQIFDPSGAKKGTEFQVNTYKNNLQDNPSVAGLTDGGFVACWSSMEQDGSGSGIFGQIFDASGVKRGNEFQVNTYTNDHQEGPSVSGLSDGGFVACWTSYKQDGSQSGIFGQIFDALGAKRGNEFQVNTYTQNAQIKPSVARLSDIGFAVCWDSYEQDGLDDGIFGQIFDVSGAKRGNEFQVNTYTKFSQYLPSVTELSNGGFVVCWNSIDQDGSANGIFGQILDAYGAKKGNEFQINTYTNDTQWYPSVSGLSNDDFVVCWESDGQDGSKTGIFGKRFPSEPIIHQLYEYSLLLPENDATINTIPFTFHWKQPSKTIECYTWELTFDLYIDTDSNFPNPKTIKNIQDTTYTIDSLAAGKTYFWKVLAKNLAGDSLWSKQQDWGFFIKPGATLVEDIDNEMPRNFELFQNYPNPFNSSTEIQYSLPNAKDSYQLQLKIYNLLGRLVKVLVNQEQAAGTHTISWDGTDLGGNRVASGVYLYSLEAGSLKSIRKMLMLQ